MQVCEQLHFFLQKAFPVAYQEREVDTRGMAVAHAVTPTCAYQLLTPRPLSHRGGDNQWHLFLGATPRSSASQAGRASAYPLYRALYP